MSKYTIDNGLIVDAGTTPPTCCGYIMWFDGRGAYSPDGKVEFTREQIDAHNKLLAQAEWEAMQKHGRGLLYLTQRQECAYKAYKVATWTGGFHAEVYYFKTSWHNMAGKDGRTDVWFMLGGRRWHGVNIGENQIVRCKALKAA